MKANDYLEVAGQLVGRIVSINQKTLLIRKIKTTFDPDKNEDVVIMLPQAVFISKKLIEASYWTKSIENTDLTTVPFDIVNSRQLISEFLDVQID